MEGRRSESGIVLGGSEAEWGKITFLAEGRERS
jgi:hypothetical protein